MMECFSDILGLHAEKLNACQMIVRGIIVFFAALILIRIAGMRTLGKQTSFDQITTLILGSILGRAVVTGQSFFGQLAAVLVIVLLHRLIALLTFKSKRIGAILKGSPLLLMEDGEMKLQALKKEHITKDDLDEALRLKVNTDEMQNVKAILLERSGEISFIEK